MTKSDPTRDLRRATPGELPSPFAGRYDVLKLLGEGGMGKVYEVLDRELGVRVALKVIASTEEPAEYLRRLRDEVRLARSITHPNVVRIFDIAEAEGRRYFTMELVAGETLDAAARGGRLTAARAGEIGLQIALGLEAAHLSGVAHRDLKPSNVLLGQNGRVVITDFGIARLAGYSTGETSGTPGFMSPEQERGEDSGVACDMYTFALLMQWLRGAAPARGEVTPEVPDVPEALTDLLARCLAEEPGLRPTATEAVTAMRTVTGHGDRAPAPATPAPVVPTRPALPFNEAKAIAVLPFKLVGSGVDPDVAEALGFELIDMLTRVRGLKVAAASATARFTDDRDPQRIGRELQVGSLVDATLRRAGERLRIDARLIDTATGFQQWSERFEEELDGVPLMQEAIAGRIAEALRVSISAHTLRGAAPADAVESYLKGRCAMHRYQLAGPGGAVDQFESCLKRAPDFVPAIAALAHCRVRLWFVSDRETSAAAQTAALEAVRRCLDVASELPESHIAAAIYRMQLGDYSPAVTELTRALTAAPTHAEAHELLAQLELETGIHTEQGMARARFALQVDPSLVNARMQLYLREWMTSVEAFDAAEAEQPWRGVPGLSPVHVARLRAATWHRRPEAASRALAAIRSATDGLAASNFEVYASVSQGRMNATEAARALGLDRETAMPPRRRSFGHRLLTEALCAQGDLDGAALHLMSAAELPMIDLDWLERCPVLAPLRRSPIFITAAKQVAARAEAVWR